VPRAPARPIFLRQCDRRPNKEEVDPRESSGQKAWRLTLRTFRAKGRSGVGRSSGSRRADGHVRWAWAQEKRSLLQASRVVSGQWPRLGIPANRTERQKKSNCPLLAGTPWVAGSRCRRLRRFPKMAKNADRGPSSSLIIAVVSQAGALSAVRNSSSAAQSAGATVTPSR